MDVSYWFYALIQAAVVGAFVRFDSELDNAIAVLLAIIFAPITSIVICWWAYRYLVGENGL